MNTYSFTPADDRKQAGLEAACAAYNEANAATEGFVPVDVQGYIQFVMDNACESYALAQDDKAVTDAVMSARASTAVSSTPLGVAKVG